MLMTLSTPIYGLKRKAKALARAEHIPLHRALDRVATQEGFASWSLLAARMNADPPSRQLMQALAPGDMVLLGARPGQGKTVLGLQLLVHAIRSGRQGAIFSFEFTAQQLHMHLQSIGANAEAFGDRLLLDTSDDICAGHIIHRMRDAAHDTVVVVDYLQMLDHKRAHPELSVQLTQLRAFAQERRMVMVFLSQIHRSFDQSQRPVPGLDDVRLPNPLDLWLFDKTCFLHDREVRIDHADIQPESTRRCWSGAPLEH